MTGRARGSELTLGERIERLVQTIHPAERGPYTDEEIVNGIRGVDGPSLSAQYLNHLRRGRRDNPTKSTLEGIARFFRVPVSYLFDDEYAEATEDDRRILTRVRAAGIEEVLSRISELPEETRSVLARIVEDLHRLHSSSRPRRRP